MASGCLPRSDFLEVIHMGILGLETAKAPAGMRSRRFLAFILDAVIVIALAYVAFRFTGQPDFFGVQAAMDAAEAAGGQDQALTAAVFTEFNKAYRIMLLIAFVYEAAAQVITNGSSVGKLIAGLQITPQNPARKRILHALLLCVRSGVKALSLYLFQGIPFIICGLTVLTNGECRSGFDMAVRSVTVFRNRKEA